VIDLHTHTTASDGRCTPEELVARAAAAGVRVLAVTDHDTIAGCRAASEACASAKITFVPGIEVTAVADGADIHVLGYFVQTNSAGLLSFLAEQRLRRVNRVREMIGRLASHDIVLDADAIHENELGWAGALLLAGLIRKCDVDRQEDVPGLGLLEVVADGRVVSHVADCNHPAQAVIGARLGRAGPGLTWAAGGCRTGPG